MSPHLRPTAQDLLQDEWFISLGIGKKPVQEVQIQFKDSSPAQGFNTDRYREDHKEGMSRNVSQGRGVAQKITTTADRSRDRRLGGGNSGLMSSTSMGKFQSEAYSTTQKSTSNLVLNSPGLKHAQTMNLPSTPIMDKGDYNSQTLNLRSLSKGKPESDQTRAKNNYFNYTGGSPAYTSGGISSSDLSNKVLDGSTTPGENLSQKIYSKSLISSASNAPPKQLYPLLQNSQQTPVYEDSPSPQLHHPLATPTSLSSTLRSQMYLPQPSPADPTPASFTTTVSPDLIHQQGLQTPPLRPPSSQDSPPQYSQSQAHLNPHPQSSTRQHQPSIDHQSTGQSLIINNLKAKIDDIEKSKDAIESKYQVMQQAMKELKKENTKLKAAVETFRGKDTLIAKLKEDCEKMQKELSERKSEVGRTGDGYEALKSEILDLARFIRSQIKPTWVVSYFYPSRASKTR